jgi:hypothetical protein
MVSSLFLVGVLLLKRLFNMVGDLSDEDINPSKLRLDG